MSDMTLYDAIQAVGYATPETIIWDGNLHRFATDATKKHSKDGWYVAHDDVKGKAAAFGSWRDGATHSWSNGTGRQLTAEEWADTEAKKKQALADEKKRREQAALRAQRLYDEAVRDVTFSAYLERKGIQCPEGVRAVQGVPSKAFGFNGDWMVSGLLVPMRDRSGAIKSLQVIPDEEKRIKLFMKGGQSAACFHAMGEIEGAKRILIGEGLATAQSAREATDAAALVAFSAGNLPDVAEIARSMNATAEIIILGDDDEAGRMKSAEAAHRAQGRAVFPGQGCNDFNDLHVAHGLKAVRTAILGAEDQDDDDIDWRAELIIKHKDDGTQIIPCRVHNLIQILTHAPEFKGRIQFNEFSGQVALDGKDLDDIGPVKIKALLERGWIKEKVSSGEVVEALSVVAHQSPFHPVRAWLDSLSWDGEPRIETFCSKYLGVPDDAYHKAVINALFVSAVLRIYKPGCKVDTMTILQGIQGLGKSKFFMALFDPWYAEITDSLNSKDFFIGLSGVWCADFGELDQFSKADSTRIKQILSSQADNYRGLWKGYHKKHPRQSIFVGGTNLDRWNNDATGGRRFLPIRIERTIDVDAVAAIKDQLFAEAAFTVKADPGRWWDIPNAAEHQEEIYVGDTWDEIIGKWLSEQYAEWSMDPYLQAKRPEFYYTTAQIIDLALKLDHGKHERTYQTRVGQSLTRLGWIKGKQRRIKGVPTRPYFPSQEWVNAQSEGAPV